MDKAPQTSPSIAQGRESPATPVSRGEARRGNRREALALLRLGAPMVMTQLFIMGNGFLDTAMAGRYSSVDLAGVSLGGALLWPLFMLMSGITMAMMPMVAQLSGARRVGESGVIIRQGIWLALANAGVGILILRNVEPVLSWVGMDAEATRIAADYLKAAAWGLPAVFVYVALRHTCEGLGHTRPPMLIAGIALLLNIPLNYMLIYGAFGFPELGGVGCGWATAAVMWIELGMMAYVTRRPFFRATRVGVGGFRPDPALLWRILKLGLPIGAAVFLEMAVYSVITLLIGRLGVSELAAHSIAGNLNWMAYVIPYSLGGAAGIRVGFCIGAGDSADARRVAATAFRISLGYALVVSLLLVAARHLLVSIYTTDAEVTAIAANILLFIAVYQIFDDTNATMTGALRGYKDTRAPMIASIAGYWVIGLPLGMALAEGVLFWAPMGVYGYWGGFTAGLFLVAVWVGMRLWRTSRDEVRIRRLALK